MVLYPQATRAHSSEGGLGWRAPDGRDNTRGDFSFFYFWSTCGAASHFGKRNQKLFFWLRHLLLDILHKPKNQV